MRASRFTVAAFAALVLLCVACGKGEDAEDRRAGSERAAGTGENAGSEQMAVVAAAARAEAQEIFKNRCAPCHGSNGRGDGPASTALTPRPRDFTDGSWQHEVTDEHIETIIVYGGAAVNKSPAMPSNPDLQSKPGVVEALREQIRGLGS